MLTPNLGLWLERWAAGVVLAHVWPAPAPGSALSSSLLDAEGSALLTYGGSALLFGPV